MNPTRLNDWFGAGVSPGLIAQLSVWFFGPQLWAWQLPWALT